MQPLVSIIIPTYNRAHLIGETLDSVLAQTYTNWECIVVDDGSTDGTEALLQKYVEHDSRFQYHHRPKDRPKGANACRNYGFELSRGVYIQWLDSDDLISTKKLEMQVTKLKNNKSIIVTCKWGSFINKTNYDLKGEGLYRDYLTGLDLLQDYGRLSTYFPIHAFLFKRSILINTNYWNESLSINQDGEYMSRILVKAQEILFENRVFVLYRANKMDNTSNYSKENIGDLIRSWNMIDTFLKIYFKKEKNIYVSDAKRRIYQYLKKDYPCIIFKNFRFFKASILTSVKHKFKFYLNKISL